MKKFIVYFEQVNQEKIEVEAKDRSHALFLTERKWKGLHQIPRLLSIEEIKQSGKGDPK